MGGFLMLMNLLPGLRDLRAPLSAGYLWLTGLWLLLVDVVPSRSTATGVVAHIYGLTHDLGRGVTLAAVSFVAYLIGVVLSVDADGFVVGFFSGIPYDAQGRPLLTVFLFLQHLFHPVDAKRRSDRPKQMSRKVVDDMRALVQRVKESVPPVSTAKSDLSDLEKSAIAEWNASLPTNYRHHDPSDWTTLVWLELDWEMRSSLANEMQLLVTQLRVTSPPLFEQYDRARGEAEFRLSVAFPLAFVLTALAWRWTPLWLFLLVGVFLIMGSGVKRAHDAMDVVGQAALTGYVAPSIWVRPEANPLTVAHMALDIALRKWTASPQDEQKIAFVLSVLPGQLPEKPMGDPPQVSP